MSTLTLSPVREAEAEPGSAALAPPLSAEDLHRIAQEAFVLGNRARREFVATLLALAVSKKYLTLGYSSIEQYAERQFGYGPSHTYELLRVAKALDNLPCLDRSFEEGRLNWSAVREVSRVAGAETEEEWLDFGRKHSVARLRAEVKDALAKNRKRPRGDHYGLPSIDVEVRFKLKPEENDILEKALKKAAFEMGNSLGAAENEKRRIEPKEALLFLARLLLETDPAGLPAAREARRDTLYHVVYRYCPDCRKSHVHTADGPVEVSAAVVERVEGAAETVVIGPEDEVAAGGPLQTAVFETTEAPAGEAPLVIDRSNTPAITRKVLLRDGHTCSNPSCRRKLDLQSHHIQFRSRGGKTAPCNEGAVCTVCHALLHAGYLSLWVSGDGDLVWRARADSLPGVEEVARGMGSMTRVRVLEVTSARGELGTISTPGEGSSARGEGSSARGELGGEMEGMRLDIISALMGLGCTKGSASQRVEEALETFRQQNQKASEEDLLCKALRCDPA